MTTTGILSKVKDRFKKAQTEHKGRMEEKRRQDAELKAIRKEEEWKHRQAHEKWRVEHKYKHLRKEEEKYGSGTVGKLRKIGSQVGGELGAISGPPSQPSPSRRRGRKHRGRAGPQPSGFSTANDAIWGSADRPSGRQVGGDIFGLEGADQITGIHYGESTRKKRRDDLNLW